LLLVLGGFATKEVNIECVRERERGEREISNFCSDGTCKKSLIQL